MRIQVRREVKRRKTTVKLTFPKSFRCLSRRSLWHKSLCMRCSWKLFSPPAGVCVRVCVRRALATGTFEEEQTSTVDIEKFARFSRRMGGNGGNEKLKSRHQLEMSNVRRMSLEIAAEPAPREASRRQRERNQINNFAAESTDGSEV